MFNDNKNFYPTPVNLIGKMWRKVDTTKVKKILEPSAGKGDILKYIENGDPYKRYDLSCIEIDNTLQGILQQDYNLIDSDFLSYSGRDQFDLIIANPPFDNGEKHLMKAIDIMYSGQIVFLLNAQTLKNPFTNYRKELVNKLGELNADIEYIENAFIDAERKTPVEIALVYINIKRNIADDLFEDCEDKAKEVNIKLEEKNEIALSKPIEFHVSDYEDKVATGLKFIHEYFKNSRKLNFELSLMKDISSMTNLKDTVNITINNYLKSLRKEYWTKVLELKDVKSRMTEKKIKEFYILLEKQSLMEFTESNIRNFIIRLIGDYENILNEAVDEVFDVFTTKHSWYPEIKKNIYLFDGWKTNNAFFVNKKVIFPVGCSYGNPFMGGYSGKWKLDYVAERKLNDIDKVMNYFDARKEYVSIADALKEAFLDNNNKKIVSTYFTINVYKKGTIHLTFNDENIRRRFNIRACKNKAFLPHDYGKKNYSSMDDKEKKIVENFEGKTKYNKNINLVGYAEKNLKMIGN
jgi:hypothetical protein